ncbi:MAG: type II toxin-antitoxin system YafQ family toxin [Neisseria sp.]|nr:type II toxin-antitoxin system YafQ family toxin [Neisseria sp.]
MAKSFKKDLKKYYLELVGEAWTEVSSCLLYGHSMPEKYRDHALTGNWKDFRDCHIKPDLVLIYRIVDDVVELHYLDSHSEIFG